MARPQRVYWDACAWIAYIAEERSIPLKPSGTENRFSMCLSILEAAKKGRVEIATSAFTLAEVCKSPEVIDSPIENLAAFFEKSYILVVPVDLSVARRAQMMRTSGLVSLKPPDCVHLASAQRARVSELHTFDRKILELDGKVFSAEGTPLRICKPTQGNPLPLFDDDSKPRE